MILRRGMFYALFGAVVVLPTWLLIGRGIVFSGSGWDFVLLLFVAPVLAIALAAVAGITVARKSVREDRAVSWIDVAVLGTWWALIVLAGFVMHDAIAVLAVVMTVAAFWIQVWQLVTETRQRFRRALDRLQTPESDVTVIRIDPAP